MEEDSSDEDEVSPPGDTHKSKESKPRETSMQPPPLPPTPGNVMVKKGYDPKQHGKHILSLILHQQFLHTVNILLILQLLKLFALLLLRNI